MIIAFMSITNKDESQEKIVRNDWSNYYLGCRYVAVIKLSKRRLCDICVVEIREWISKE